MSRPSFFNTHGYEHYRNKRDRAMDDRRRQDGETYLQVLRQRQSIRSGRRGMDDHRMLYLAIDQHKSQLTVHIRNEHGDVIQKGQVSTVHAEIDDFFVNLVAKARRHRGFMAPVEVCARKHVR